MAHYHAGSRDTEELFDERGLDRVSIRDSTRKARVNLTAINYHFGSK
ncbi:MAG: hypothetical protein DME24_00030 [Verrucomicrobia bacterium]|nr:MAG: hypothetical protein DME24_00030 [Verrucomicrobiota bacterium]